jgi:hypothetical protein
MYESLKWGGITWDQHGFQSDVRDTMNRPMLRAAWEINKKYRSAEFVNFVDKCISGKPVVQ